MRLRRTREHVTPVKPAAGGHSFEMSPGVTVTVTPNDDSAEMDWFARRLAETIQRVAREDWV